MTDRTLFPWTYTLEERKWELEIGIDQGQRQFSLKINDRPFSDLMDVNTATENLIQAAEDSSNSLVGSIMFNEV